MHLPSIALGIAALTPSIGRADTILFDTLSGTIQIDATVALSRIDKLFCEIVTGYEICGFNLLSPPGATLLSTTPQNIAVAAAPGPSYILDDIVAGTATTFVGFNFDYLIDPTKSDPCNMAVGAICRIVADGGVQTAFQLLWSDGTDDTIEFESLLPGTSPPATALLIDDGTTEIIPVQPPAVSPEPATWILFAIGLAGLLARAGAHGGRDDIRRRSRIRK